LAQNNECRPIQYRILSLTYKTLTTSQPAYLCDMISVQPPRSIRSSSVITLARPPTYSSLRITNQSFQYAASGLWNQLPDSFRSLLILSRLLIHLIPLMSGHLEDVIIFIVYHYFTLSL